MAELRIGDTVFDSSGRGYRLEERDDDDNLVGVDMLNPRKKRTFSDSDDLHCVDADDGLWQEMK